MSTNSKGDGVKDQDENPVTIHAGCCACNGIRKETRKLDEDAVGSAAAQSKMVAEKAFDSTVSRIKSSLSWASAGLLGTATSGTIDVSLGDTEWQTVLASWIYVIVLSLITVSLQTVTIDALDAPDSIGKELDTTVPPRLGVVCYR